MQRPESTSVHHQGSGSTAMGPGATSAGAGGVAVGGDVYGNVTVGAATMSASAEDLRQAYLSWLFEQVRAVPLTGVDPKSIREEVRRDLDLAAVYTALMTQRTEATSERTGHLEREHRPLSALAVLNTESRLALLGEPGSGKSTFVNFVALCLAGDRLSRSDANLETLRAPMAEEDPESKNQDDETPASQSWDHGPLLPIRILLREFVARGLTQVGASEGVNADTLWQFIISELPEALRAFAPILQRDLHEQGGLLLLDGLDEVPEAEARRVQVKTAVEAFAATFPKVGILVTSRTYAYQKQDWKLRGFAEAVLTPFEEAQIRRFVERWYAYVGAVRGLSESDVKGRIVLLSEAIRRNPRLHELATRPLLLTLMASLHTWRGGTLPEQREELYADAVELLLDQWESQKVQRRADGSYEVAQPSLVEWLQIDQKAMRDELNHLAFEAHYNQPTLVGTADIAQARLVQALMQIGQNPDVRPQRLIEYLSQRAGLLEPRGVGIYAFPHRTFQEYLAACYLTDSDFPDQLADLLRAEPNRWREVTLLAGAKATRGTASAAWTLAEALCYEPPLEAKSDDLSGYWGALLAAQVLIETNSLKRVTPRNQDKVERIRTWLVRILGHQALPAVERAQAGNALAHFNDPRFRTDAWFLPDEPLLGFVEIPAGPFVMGSDDKIDSSWTEAKPRHEVILPTYYMARYPVTVAQFQTFVETSGYVWAHKDRPQGGPHHPVVYVSWNDAVAYSEWLTQCLSCWPETPDELRQLLYQDGGRVLLPSEAEWEKAARGTDARAYPWGEEFDADRANAGAMGIGSTSTVGCFPSGQSPYGIEELSGNVFEWTRSMSRYYPYPSDQAQRHQREALQSDGSEGRVVRGGSFIHYPRLVRCAYRNDDDPRYADDSNGFRVVVSVLT